MGVKIKETSIRASVLSGFAEAVEAAGGDPKELVRAVGIRPSALEDLDGMISYPAVCSLLEMTAHQLDRPSLGLEWALRTPWKSPKFGPTAFMGLLASTMEERFETALKWTRLHTNAFAFQLMKDDVSGDAVHRTQFSSFGFPARQLTEHRTAIICIRSRHVSGQLDANPIVVRFQHRQPKDLSVHEQVFRCPVEFNADYTDIVFDVNFLKTRTNGSLRGLKPVFDYLVKERISRIAEYDGSLTTTLSQAIHSIIGSGSCKIDFMAEMIGLNTHTLQRKLAAEGTTFSEVLEEVRRTMAISLLTDSDISIERISGLLEYSATPAFTLAFSRWTGKSPLAYRKIETGNMDV